MFTVLCKCNYVEAKKCNYVEAKNVIALNILYV